MVHMCIFCNLTKHEGFDVVQVIKTFSMRKLVANRIKQYWCKKEGINLKVFKLLCRSDMLKFIKQMLKLHLLVLDIFCQSLYSLLQLHSTVVFTLVFFVV